MTSTAANVLQAYWSHDLGGYNVFCPANPETITPCPCGHVVVPCNLTLGTCKRADGELYARWLQFGALSPIMRTQYGATLFLSLHCARPTDTASSSPLTVAHTATGASGFTRRFSSAP